MDEIKTGLFLDNDMAEFCGVLIGDGNIWTNGRKYEITITGNPKDKNYLDKLSTFVSNRIKPNPYYRLRGRGLRLTIYSKQFFLFLTKEVGIISGKQKNTGPIPKSILASSRSLKLRFIRGIFDTDGSVFTSDKKGVENYPTIEITNENSILLLSIRKILYAEGFKTTFRKSNTNTFKIAIHGNKMLRLWLDVVGSSHPRKRLKMESIIKTSCS
jgi:intein/homing endonuclease